MFKVKYEFNKLLYTCTLIVNKSPIFFKFGMVLGMGNVFSKFIAKKGMTSVDLLVKFKMAAKTAVKIINVIY